MGRAVGRVVPYSHERENIEVLALPHPDSVLEDEFSKVLNVVLPLGCYVVEGDGDPVLFTIICRRGTPAFIVGNSLRHFWSEIEGVELGTVESAREWMDKDKALAEAWAASYRREATLRKQLLEVRGDD